MANTQEFSVLFCFLVDTVLHPFFFCFFSKKKKKITKNVSNAFSVLLFCPIGVFLVKLHYQLHLFFLATLHTASVLKFTPQQ